LAIHNSFLLPDFHAGCFSQDFTGALSRALAQCAEHLGQFLHPAIPGQNLHPGLGSSVVNVVGDMIMGIAISGNLGQVCHTEDLMLTLVRQLPQFPADYPTDPSTDALVNFVKNQGGSLVSDSQHGFESQHDPAGFAAGGYFDQRLEGFAGVGPT
jgi:hypothetical protein